MAAADQVLGRSGWCLQDWDCMGRAADSYAVWLTLVEVDRADQWLVLVGGGKAEIAGGLGAGPAW